MTSNYQILTIVLYFYMQHRVEILNASVGDIHLDWYLYLIYKLFLYQKLRQYTVLGLAVNYDNTIIRPMVLHLLRPH